MACRVCASATENQKENCSGRQKAPFCPPSQISSWSEEHEIVKNLFINSSPIQNSINNASKDFETNFGSAITSES